MNTAAILILGLPLLCFAFFALAGISLIPQFLNESSRKRTIWPQFADWSSGILTPGGYVQPDMIVGKLNGDPLYVDTTVYGVNHTLVNSTRMRLFYRALRPVYIVIRTQDMTPITQEDKRLQQVDSGSLGLPSRILVFASESEIVRSIMDAQMIVSIGSLQNVDLQIRRRRNWKTEGVSNSIHEVHILKPGVLTELNDLIGLYQIVDLLQSKLRELGIAGEMAPQSIPEIDYFSSDGAYTE